MVRLLAGLPKVPGVAEGAGKLLIAPYLMPTEKGMAPFQYWAVDTIVGLKPAAPDDSTSMIVACNPFVRWLEAGKLPVLYSHKTVVWFHQEITCRYGLLRVVHSN